SMGMLKRVFLMRKLMPKTKVVVQDYESCLEAQMIGARNMCRAMQFSKGRRLFKKAHYLLKYSRPVNTSLLQKASSQRGECGLFTLDFSVKMRAVSGGVPYILPASSQLTVVNTPDRKGIKACGVLSFKRTAVKRGVCTAQATVPETRPHYICLKGTITRQAGKKYPIARLSFDGTMARTLVRESVQYICPKKAPVVFNERLFEQLLVPKHMHLAIPVVGSEKKMFRLSLDPGGARKSVFQGSYTLHFL
ncbi:hypothetical protein KJ865_10005, partial [Myxococcota bacterium]|nr:hypothetical protein [Myxococcota bacterium]